MEPNTRNECEILKSKDLESTTLKEKYANELHDSNESNKKLRQEKELLDVKCERLSLELQATKSTLIELQRKIDEERGARQSLVSQLVQGEGIQGNMNTDDAANVFLSGSNAIGGLLDSVSEYAGHKLSRKMSGNGR